MRKYALVISLGLAMVCCTPMRTHAQDFGNADVETSSRMVPDTAWQRLTKSPAYSYRNLREAYKKPKASKPSKPSVIELLIRAIIGFFTTTVGKILLWGVVIGALLYGLWMAFFKSSRFSFGGRKKAGAEEDPTVEDLHGTSWLRLMDEAVATGDTRLAVRYGYLHILQILSETERIHYRPGKTNADYAAELAGSPRTADFRALSRAYEYTWYGSYPITATAFADYRARMAGVENSSRG